MFFRMILAHLQKQERAAAQNHDGRDKTDNQSDSSQATLGGCLDHLLFCGRLLRNFWALG